MRLTRRLLRRSRPARQPLTGCRRHTVPLVFYAAGILDLLSCVKLGSVRKLPCHLVTGVGQVVNLRADWLSAQLARLTIGPQLTKLPHSPGNEPGMVIP